MANFTVVSTGPSLEQWIEKRKRVFAEELHQAGLAIKNTAVEIATTEVGLDSGEYLRGIVGPEAASLDDGRISETVRFTHPNPVVPWIVEEGAGPSHENFEGGADPNPMFWPNVDAIKAWLSRQGTPEEDLDQAAYLVGRHINEQGLHGHHVAWRSLQAADVDQVLKDIAGRIARG